MGGEEDDEQMRSLMPFLSMFGGGGMFGGMGGG